MGSSDLSWRGSEAVASVVVNFSSENRSETGTRSLSWGRNESARQGTAVFTGATTERQTWRKRLATGPVESPQVALRDSPGRWTE
jgi:hypothetical protein